MPNATGDGPRDTIQSVEKAFRVLEAVRDGGPAGVTEIASRIGAPKSSVHHYARTLESMGYLDKDGGAYDLGIRLLSLGGPARSNQHLFQLARDDVDDLAERTGEQARLIREQDGYEITLYQATGENLPEPYGPLGGIDPLHCTAAGKAFLAELSETEVAQFLDELDLTPRTPNTITEPEELRRELEAIRERGVAFDDRERYEGVRCVAAAIGTDATGSSGAISVSGPVERMDDERFRETIPDVIQNYAGVVEVNTVYSEWAEG
ncbi:MAG: IclR family transcriptional regulator [Haloarculaceae archaeon]